jgi:hypothetical protein
MNLASLWTNSYFRWTHPLTPWKPGMKFDDWWGKAKHDFAKCLAEVLAEKVDCGDLKEEHALRIGRQVLRDNALELFPQLKDRLWKQKGKLTPPPGKVRILSGLAVLAC